MSNESEQKASPCPVCKWEHSFVSGSFRFCCDIKCGFRCSSQHWEGLSKAGSERDDYREWLLRIQEDLREGREIHPEAITMILTQCREPTEDERQRGLALQDAAREALKRYKEE